MFLARARIGGTPAQSVCLRRREIGAVLAKIVERHAPERRLHRGHRGEGFACGLRTFGVIECMTDSITDNSGAAPSEEQDVPLTATVM